MASGILQAEGRPWLDWKDVAEAGQFDHAALIKVFDRAEAEQQYASARAAVDGKARDVQVSKLAGDFLAGLERDERMRRRSPIRCFVHAAARAAARGMDTGPLRRNTVDWLGRILAEEDKGVGT